jgi:hypothetical protein
LFLVVVQVDLPDAVVVDLEWVVAVVDMPLKFNMLTAVTSLQDLHSIQSVLVPPADVPAVDVVMVEELVVSMVVPPLFLEVDWEPSVCRAVHTQHKDVLRAVTAA